MLFLDQVLHVLRFPFILCSSSGEATSMILFSAFKTKSILSLPDDTRQVSISSLAFLSSCQEFKMNRFPFEHVVRN